MKIDSVSIVYFSPTGTTKKIIHAVSQGMAVPIVQQIDLAVPEVRNDVPASLEGDGVLIGVPVYAFGIPQVIHSFIANLPGDNKPVVLIAVYGNVTEGVALNELYSLTERQGFKVIGAGTFIGEHSFSTEETPLAKGRPNHEDLNSAEEFGRKIMEKLHQVDDVKDLSLKIPQSKWRLFVKSILGFRGRLFPNAGITQIFSKLPLADLNLCNRCGVCVKSCPMGAIDRENLAIKAGLCLRCFSCVKRCPRKARKITYRPKFPVSKVLAAKNKVAKNPQVYL